MDEPRPVDKTCISYHAVTRYVQRVEDVDVDDVGPYKDEKARALAHACAVGKSVDQIRDILWTPGLAKAVELGFQRVHCGALIFRIVQPERIVATLHLKKERQKRRFKLLSRAEVRGRAKRTERNMKRKPKGSWS